MTAAPTPVTCRPKDAPTVLGVSRSQLYRLADEGKIKLHRRAGMTWVVVSEWLDYVRGSDGSVGD